MELVRRRKRVLKLRDEARKPQKANAGVHLLLFSPWVLQSFSGVLFPELEFTVLPLPRFPFLIVIARRRGTHRTAPCSFSRRAGQPEEVERSGA